MKDADKKRGKREGGGGGTANKYTAGTDTFIKCLRGLHRGGYRCSIKTNVEHRNNVEESSEATPSQSFHSRVIIIIVVVDLVSPAAVVLCGL